MKRIEKGYLIFGFFLLLAGCSEPTPRQLSDQGSETPTRWYNNEQVLVGAQVFAENCAVCHGDNAEGRVSDWRQRLEDGSLPPPPLNGSAHAWHHPNSVLLQVINNGGTPFGGTMPAFVDVLGKPDKLAVIAYFQNFWSDEIYAQWIQMGGPD